MPNSENDRCAQKFMRTDSNQKDKFKKLNDKINELDARDAGKNDGWKEPGLTKH